MTTSGTINVTYTARDIVEMALDELGITDSTTDLDMNDAGKVLRRLNMMLKTWQADGNHLWLREDVSMEWPAGEFLGELDPRIMQLLSLRWVSDGAETPMQQYAREQWDRLPNKTTTGTPFIYRFTRQGDLAQVALYPVPDDDMSLVGEAVRIIQDVTDLSQTLDVPQEWLETVFVNLAARCANMFGKAGTPRAANIEARAADLLNRMTGLDREGSIRFRARRYR